jgi:endonuclease III
MLSSQTKDEVTDVAVGKLRTALGGTLSLDGLLAAEEHVIADAINKVGFWRRKTQFSLPFPPFPRSPFAKKRMKNGIF